MDSENLPQRLSQIPTAWTVLFEAHVAGPDELVKEARRQLVQQYGAAAYRYLRAAVRDEEEAMELYQEFALRLVRGDFQRAHPDRGRFRDFLKTALYHLIVDHQRRRHRRPAPLSDDGSEATVTPEATDPAEEDFPSIWRAFLLARAWEALEGWERQTGQPLYTVLRLRSLHPEWQSPQLAEQVAAQLRRSLTPGWVRKRLHFARAKFTALLLQEVRNTLDEPSPEALEQELLDLGLLDYCRSALGREETDA